ncbi:hypothetical protein B5P44_01365 [Mycobacterium sp. CBMA 213]|uniref:Uncharacterized protein n=1 Tax=Mycolicibacterium sp. CBMA 213 TaxID=1968788 RepID=A0A343VRS1_9MYCO|nr:MULTISPECIES: hypothetical protein [unclassified Mycolicibacterium]AVN58595.1 hypothetical protein B5P44_p00302 [Mycolicibacterium sp. CBMA 213]MUL61232.1 hypothetical protein [Mycolicibacterium sp. CBMA 335]MUM03468.1 hypothetical protein [Mycolicibacterium sp. CBMA 213]
MFVCEFQKISNGRYFGRSEHPDRTAAEKHATTELIGFGEDPVDVRNAVAVASVACADTSADGYGVRIFEG